MLNTNLWKRTQVLALALILLMLLTAVVGFAATKIIGKDGGRIYMKYPTVFLEIPPNVLETETLISADMVEESGRVSFYFGPDGTTFDSKPALLYVNMADMGDVDDFTLYGESGEEIQPRIVSGIGVRWVTWDIPHFSLYYYRRR